MDFRKSQRGWNWKRADRPALFQSPPPHTHTIDFETLLFRCLHVVEFGLVKKLTIMNTFNQIPDIVAYAKQLKKWKV